MNKNKNRKIVAYPMMGNVYIPVRAVLYKMGAKFVKPVENNKKMLDLGVRHSLEGICLPYKLNLGNYIQALQAGANTLVMFQAPGTCRLGNYTKMSTPVLQNMGYDFEMVVFDMYKDKMKTVIEKFCYVAETKNPFKIVSGFALGFDKFFALDEIEKKLFYIRPREINRGDAEKVYKKGRKLIDRVMSKRLLKRVMQYIFAEYAKIKIDEKKDVPIVYLIGEFFVVLDPYSNMDIEKELGHMGVEVQRQIMLSKWLEKVLKPSFLYRKESHRQRSLNYAKGFIKRAIGGECLESIGDAVYAAKNNVDGVIHLSPFNCTPEVVAQNILPKVREQEGIPILSLMLDEFTGRAGYITRIEAFVDLIKRGKLKQTVSVN